MRRWPPTILVAAALAVGGCGSQFGAGSQLTTTTATRQTAATVVRVVDGDTIKVRIGSTGRPQTVRLALIDAPESSTQRYGHAECGGVEATSALKRLVDGREVQLRHPSSQRSEDRYGRLIREVLVGGRSIDEQLVRDGWSKPYRVPNGGGGKESNARIADAAREAERHQRGAWTRCGGFDRQRS